MELEVFTAFLSAFFLDDPYDGEPGLSELVVCFPWGQQSARCDTDPYGHHLTLTYIQNEIHRYPRFGYYRRTYELGVRSWPKQKLASQSIF